MSPSKLTRDPLEPRLALSFFEPHLRVYIPEGFHITTWAHGRFVDVFAIAGKWETANGDRYNGLLELSDKLIQPASEAHLARADSWWWYERGSERIGLNALSLKRKMTDFEVEFWRTFSNVECELRKHRHSSWRLTAARTAALVFGAQNAMIRWTNGPLDASRNTEIVRRQFDPLISRHLDQFPMPYIGQWLARQKPSVADPS